MNLFFWASSCSASNPHRSLPIPTQNPTDLSNPHPPSYHNPPPPLPRLTSTMPLTSLLPPPSTPPLTRRKCPPHSHPRTSPSPPSPAPPPFRTRSPLSSTSSPYPRSSCRCFHKAQLAYPGGRRWGCRSCARCWLRIGAGLTGRGWGRGGEVVCAPRLLVEAGGVQRGGADGCR